jgi:hypothetical protein
LVERLNFHLENEQVVFPDSTDIEKRLIKKGVKETKFTKWMELNKTNVDAKQLIYIDLPTKYVWTAEKKLWAKR